MIAREASPTGSVQSANFPSWDHLAQKLRSVGLSEGELQKAKKELDASRYYRIAGVSPLLWFTPGVISPNSVESDTNTWTLAGGTGRYKAVKGEGLPGKR
jgi:hypothetical protein